MLNTSAVLMGSAHCFYIGCFEYPNVALIRRFEIPWLDQGGGASFLLDIILNS